MRILALETSGKGGGVAIAEGSKVVIERELPCERRSAQSLAPTIRAVLEAAGWTIKEIDLIGVTVGPGSFTGLRIGLATAKTLAYALGARCVGFNTLEVIAPQAPHPHTQLSVAMDAQRGQVFAATFELLSSIERELPREPSPIWRMTTNPSVVDVDEWLGTLGAGVAATGPALVKLAKQLPAGVAIIDEKHWMPRASTVAALAWCRHLEAVYDDVWTLAPFYLRKSAAEEKREGKERGSRIEY